MSAGFWFVLVLVCVISITLGVVDWLVGRKHGRKSGNGFWAGLFILSELFDCFDDKNK